MILSFGDIDRCYGEDSELDFKVSAELEHTLQNLDGVLPHLNPTGTMIIVSGTTSVTTYFCNNDLLSSFFGSTREDELPASSLGRVEGKDSVTCRVTDPMIWVPLIWVPFAEFAFDVHIGANASDSMV